jgi:hypothetical protein
MMLLLPMMFFTGLNNTFYAAWFTRQIQSCHTGMVLLALGAGEVVGAYAAGAAASVTSRSAHHIFMHFLFVRKNCGCGEERAKDCAVHRDDHAGCGALPLRQCQCQR